MAPHTDPHTVINVCMCTYNRPAVAKTIESVVNQVLPDGVGLRIVVADNTADATARELVAKLIPQLDVELVYVHAPANNISIARNACLDASEGDWVAFIDDDEYAAPDWLSTIFEAAQSLDLDVVFGLVQAVYPDDAPQWAVETDLFSTFVAEDGADLRTGYTGNTLIHVGAPALKGRRFSHSRGKTGGEDSEYFYRAWQDGAKLGKCKSAVVYEPVPPHRMSLDWLAERTRHAGTSYARLQHGQPGSLAQFRLFVLSALKLSVSAGFEMINYFSPVQRVKWYIRRCFHHGVLSGVLGTREREIYKDANA